jgi:CBS domain-containing protein
MPTAVHPEEGLPQDPEDNLSPHPAHASTFSPPPSQFADLHDAPNASAADSPPYTDRFHPLATATLQTTVFDVVHLFSDLGISAVPIVDNETGQVINLYEAVDVVDLVRSNAYQVLDLTIEDALSRRSKDFPGVVTCTPEDSLASILAYVREKRAHRFVIVESDDPASEMQGGGPGKVPGRLVGILCLSDILKYIVGSSSLSGVKVVGLGFRSEEEGLAIPRVVGDDELDEINEGVSGLGIQ